MELITIAAGLAPLVIDFGKNLLNRWLPAESYKPANIQEYIQMKTLDLERFKAGQDPGTDTGFPVVNAMLRLQKPAFATLVLMVWAWQENTLPTGASESVQTFAQTIGFWMFGETGLFVGKKTAAAVVPK